MPIYTLRGSEALDVKIAADLERIKQCVSPHSKAGILLGSYGRGEGTPFIQPDGTQTPFNDYDLVIITDSANAAVKSHFRTLQQELTEQIGLTVDLCPYAFRSLSRCEFSLLNYEMKNGHRVLWGPENMLDSMPEYDPQAIPLSEGTRLLLNRGKLLLDIQDRLQNPEPLNREEHLRYLKFLVKVLLAFGDSILLLSGRYELSYSVKKEQIGRTGTFPASDYIIDGYKKAVELKESGDFHAWSSFNMAEEFETVREVYLNYMPWYRARCIDCGSSALKNIVLNLKWNRSLKTAHPRERLYDAVIALLQGDDSVMKKELFYKVWRRFS